MACYSQTGLLQSLDILYKIQYTRVEGDVYAIALHETSLLSVYLLVRGLYFYLHTRFSCHRLPKLYANPAEEITLSLLLTQPAPVVHQMARILPALPQKLVEKLSL